MIDQQLQECIKAAHKAGLQNAEQLSRDSVLIRFVQLCSWYSQIQKERDNLLEALESIVAADDQSAKEIGLEDYEHPSTAKARAAIAKVKGEAQ
jgi:L-lactate utilization protein LutB